MKLYNWILGIIVVGLLIFVSYLVDSIPTLWIRLTVSGVLGLSWVVTFVVVGKLSK